MQIRRLFRLCCYLMLCAGSLASCESAATRPAQAQTVTPGAGAVAAPTATVFVPLVMADSAKEGEMGIVFQNGVECLGEEADPLQRAIIFVSPTGDDNNPGSEESPLASLAHALCNITPGQTLKVLPGIYTESVILGAFGNATQPIAIEGVVEGGRWPVLDGESIRTMGLAFVESVNVSVENLEFRNYTDEGLLVLLGSDFVLRNNRFVDNGRASIDPDAAGEGFGVNIVGVRQVLVEKNEAVGNGPNPERWQKGTLGTGINTFELVDGIIRDNDVHDTVGGGVLVEDGAEVLVENNRIHTNELDANGDYWDGGVWVDGSKNVTLRGNVIRGNHGPGVVLSDENVQYPQTSFGYVLEANTISGNLYGVHIWNWGQCPVTDESIIRLTDNQFSDNRNGDIWCQEWVCGEGQPCGD